MNIVKIKDIKTSELPAGISAIEFAKFKGLYCFCVNWKWIVLFSEYTVSEIVYCEQNSWVDAQRAFALYSTYLNAGLVDVVETDKINSITTFVEFNKFTPKEEDLTAEEVKAFRTWLAETLYQLLKDTASFEVVSMLEYYRKEMNDDTVKHIKAFIPKKEATKIVSVEKDCSCSKSLNDLFSSSVTTCDTEAIYRKGIYDKMVEVFSETDFWMTREDQLLKEMKRYVDYIIAWNLPLISSPYVSDFYDCGCLTTRSSAQEMLMQILKDLSKSLEYMINTKDSTYTGKDTVEGHKNFIADTLLAWSSKLYESMRWYS